MATREAVEQVRRIALHFMIPLPRPLSPSHGLAHRCLRHTHSSSPQTGTDGHPRGRVNVGLGGMRAIGSSARRLCPFTGYVGKPAAVRTAQSSHSVALPDPWLGHCVGCSPGAIRTGATGGGCVYPEATVPTSTRSRRQGHGSNLVPWSTPMFQCYTVNSRFSGKMGLLLGNKLADNEWIG